MPDLNAARPDVSVVMSVYNGADYLAAAVNSIVEQRGVSWEFIIVDDGSTDNTPQILDEFASHDPRIRLFRHENQGLTRSLIFGCSQARADFIARQDADDLSLPARLRKQHALISADHRLALVSCWTRYIGPEHEVLGMVQRPESAEQATHGLLHERQGPPAHGSVMFRKSVYEEVGGYREAFYFGQDSDLWLRLCRRGNIGSFPECLYEARMAPNSISGEKRDIQKLFGELGQKCHAARMSNEPEQSWLEAAQQLRSQVVSGEVNRSSPRRIRSNASYFIGSALHSQKHPSAKIHLRNALKNNPLHWRAWIKLILAVLTSDTQKHVRSIPDPEGTE